MIEDAPHILVVDDDTRLRELLQRYLSEQGFRITTAGDAADARGKLTSIAFDLIVLDIMMPGETGLDLTKALRKRDRVPVLLLTAMGEIEHRILGLECGADDYLTKPFEPRELVLRINAILRRTHEPVTPPDTEVRFGDYRFDLKHERLRKGQGLVRLTTGEAALLKALARQPGVPVSRETLLSESPMIGNPRAIDVQVTRLRRKIEEDPKYPRYLQAVRGVGYILIPD